MSEKRGRMPSIVLTDSSLDVSTRVQKTIHAVQAKKNNEVKKDFSVFVRDDGSVVSTKERIVKSVPYPAANIPEDSEVFLENGKPNLEFLQNHFFHEGRLSDKQVKRIVSEAQAIFRKEETVIDIPAPITICGDIHGQYYDLLKLLEVGGDPATNSYLFLGDYVDRGDYACECVLYLYALKITYPSTFFMLRGNHECRHLTEYFTFKTECNYKYNTEIYDVFCDSFDCLPLAAYVNKQFFCCHGGLSPEAQTIDDVRRIDRFREPPTKGMMCDILWSDPLEDYDRNVNARDFTINSLRGCSYAYSYRGVCKFLERNNLLSVIRAHEVQSQGYRMYKATEKMGFPSLLTLFSAPNYVDSFDNRAAILKYENNIMNIRQFNSSPHPYRLPKFMDVFSWSLPFIGEKVTQMLMAILNVCTQEELDVVLPVESILAGVEGQSKKPAEEDIGPCDVVESPAGEKPEGETKAAERTGISEAKRTALRNKVMAIGRMSRMFQVLRGESEQVNELKAKLGGRLPSGTLMLGSEGIKNAIHSFEEARRMDMANESMPPPKEELEEKEKERIEVNFKKAIAEADHDRTIQKIARRLSEFGA